MGLELLERADYVLNACGRPVPPPGYKFVDLPRIIPFHQTVNQSAAIAATGFFGDDESIVKITAVTPGAAGNSITINLQGGDAPPGTPWNSAACVEVVGTTITYLQGTVVPPLSTNESMIQAFAANSAAAALVTMELSAGTLSDPGWGKNPAPGNLSGGADATGTGQYPSQPRVENLANTLFIVKGIVLSTDPVQVRIKWPSGRYWNQFPFGVENPCNPQGTGGNMYALDEEVAIERGGKIAIEISGPNEGPVDIGFWGVLRYLLKATGGDAGQIDGQTCIVGYPNTAKAQGPPNCLIGYPVSAAAKGKPGLQIINDPVEVLKLRPRFECWPNGNIMAPEFLLGNQCETDTPPDKREDAYTFFSPTVTVMAGDQSYSNQITVPGQDDVVIRRWRAVYVWGDGASGAPLIGLRSPTGYSVTGGDLVDLSLLYWIPMFPTLRMRAGTDLIFDVGFPLVQGNTGSVSVTLEFDAIKQRKRT